MLWAFLDSHDLNFSNRPVRTLMPGGVAGAQLTAAPYADKTLAEKTLQIKNHHASNRYWSSSSAWV
ncbi:hypothetical protein DTF36_17640 [Salmonella enterica subsp. enterica]|nr:hypothetical protein [Salmonella enterica subsp. enterica]MKP46096.1 hypothetical protein [Salmonella enterica subsp. enterica]